MTAQILALLKCARKMAGLTCKQVGAHLKISEATYYRYETGALDMSLDKFIAICQFLKLPDVTEILSQSLFPSLSSRTVAGQLGRQIASHASDKELIINDDTGCVENPAFST